MSRLVLLISVSRVQQGFYSLVLILILIMVVVMGLTATATATAPVNSTTPVGFRPHWGGAVGAKCLGPVQDTRPCTITITVTVAVTVAISVLAASP